MTVLTALAYSLAILLALLYVHLVPKHVPEWYNSDILQSYEVYSESLTKHSQVVSKSLQKYHEKGTVDIVLLIITAPDNFEFRSHLRTEGYLTYQWEYKFRQSYSTLYKFVCGKPDNQTLLHEMEKEMAKFGDLVIGDYHDTYENLVYKTIWLLRYGVTKFNFDFLMKIDDDTFINSQLLFDFLYRYIKPAYNDLHQGYYGGMIRHGPREIQREGKWGIESWEIPLKQLDYPPYVVGGAYIMNKMAATAMIELNSRNEFVAFRVEDAYVGALANRLSLIPKDIPKTYSKQYDRFCGDKNGKIFHRVAPSFQIKMLRNWTTLGYYCPPEQVKTLKQIEAAGEEMERKY